jgi:hypothetical protein
MKHKIHRTEIEENFKNTIERVNKNKFDEAFPGMRPYNIEKTQEKLLESEILTRKVKRELNPDV